MDQSDKRFAEFAEKIDVIKREVDAAQISIAHAFRPWYKDGAAIVSVLAFLFSFGTTFVSYKRTETQDIQQAKSDLRGLLQRLAALPKDNYELLLKYKDDVNTAQFLSGYINQENALLARQAADIAERIPGQITSTEYFAVHSALRLATFDQLATKFLEKAVEKADNPNDAVAALRAQGTYLFSIAQPEAGRAAFQKALDVFRAYPGQNEYYQLTTHILTYLNWQAAEGGIGRTNEAARLLGLAEDLHRRLQPAPFTDQIGKQIEQARGLLVSSRPR